MGLTSWFPNNPTNTHSHAQEVKASGEIVGWSDWAWLTGGCLSFTLPAPGLILPQQPCRFPCSRPLTGSRKRPGLSVSCPGSAALRLMTPTALRWQLRNKKQHWLADCEVFFLSCWSTLEIPALSLSWHVSRLSNFLPELILPSSLNCALLLQLRHLALHWWTSVQSPKRCDQAGSRAGTTFFTEEFLTNRPAICLSAVLWDSAVPLWQILLYTQQRANTQVLRIANMLNMRLRKKTGKGTIIKGLPQSQNARLKTICSGIFRVKVVVFNFCSLCILQQ